MKTKRESWLTAEGRRAPMKTRVRAIGWRFIEASWRIRGYRPHFDGGKFQQIGPWEPDRANRKPHTIEPYQ